MNTKLLAASWQSGTNYLDFDFKGQISAKVPFLSGLEVIFQNVLNLVAAGAGLACFVMLLVGGFKYLTAQGDPKKTEGAKQTLTWAIVGLVITIGAWFVLRFISEFTGLDSLLQFRVPEPAVSGCQPANCSPNPCPGGTSCRLNVSGVCACL